MDKKVKYVLNIKARKYIHNIRQWSQLETLTKQCSTKKEVTETLKWFINLYTESYKAMLNSEARPIKFHKDHLYIVHTIEEAI